MAGRAPSSNSTDHLNRGVFLCGGRRVELRDVDMPEAAPDEVVLRVEATGICGSDLHVYRGDRPSAHPAGHEPAGVVEAVGEATNFLKPGDRVAVHHHVARSGRALACGDYVFCPHDRIVGVHRPGSFTRFLAVPERNCVLLPDGVSFEDGVFLACVGSTAYAAIRRLEVEPGQTMAVFGLGPVGLSATLIATAMGLKVLGVDRSAERLEQARRCGAERVVHADEPALLRAIRDFAPAAWPQRPPHAQFSEDVAGVHYVLETSGFAAAQKMILPALRIYGKAAIVGVGHGDRVINPEELSWKANTLIGSLVFPWSWMWDLAAFMANTGLRFEPAVTHRFPLEEASQAFAEADAARAGKVILLPQG